MIRNIAKSSLTNSIRFNGLKKRNFDRLTVHPLSSSKSWVPVSDEKLQKITIQSLVHEVAENQRNVAANVVPWFFKNMPAAYFRQIPESSRARHVQAIIAIREMMGTDLSLKMESKGENDTLQLCYIHSATTSGMLHSQIKSLVIPDNYKLENMNVFSSLDGEMSLNVFNFAANKDTGRTASLQDAEKIMEFIEEIKAGKHEGVKGVPSYSDIFSAEAMADYLKRVEPEYAQKSHPRRFLIQREMFEQVRGGDGTTVIIEPKTNDGAPDQIEESWITIASANVLPEVLLRLCSGIVSARGLDIRRAHLDRVRDPDNSTPEFMGSVTMLRMLVSPITEDVLLSDPKFMEQLCRDLKRSKWLDNSTTELGLQKYPVLLGIERAEVFTALCSMLHGPLAKIDPGAFTGIRSIIQILESHTNYITPAAEIAQLFLDRFNPAQLEGPKFNAEAKAAAGTYQTRKIALAERISALQNENAKLVLTKMLQVTDATLRTNFFNDDRYALSLRVDPLIMMPNGEVSKTQPQIPFGVFFVHGRWFNAFHCRFRDIARGGLRIVTPHNSDNYAQESSKTFDEVYGLSYAQQLKNKDIPEGGAKGVLLVNTPGIPEKSHFFTKRKAVKAFTDAMMDLIVTNSVANLVDFYGKEELIYFGPDEQIIPSDIEWMVHRAKQRGYPIPDAVMSSKKDAGFNHKEFGVTSEGVVVCLDVGLRSVLNINPEKEPFTVKVTGGPDGDVAGNLMKILHRNYGENCKIVGVADGSGVAEDPNGLNNEELLRLVEDSLPIADFNNAKLSKDGICLPVSDPEGMVRRNTMHFRVKADAFVPAGGRPNTINADNWSKFILESKNGEIVPSSKLIVEGANLFLTPDARQSLFDHAGVVIVKDSSANKCGVITSSVEVAASMLLSKDEFMAVKPELVQDMLHQLRRLARLEASLLFREFRNYPGALPHFSERISFAIGKVTDALTDALANTQRDDPLFVELLPLIQENLPKKLRELAKDRIATRLPIQYQRNAIASTLASKLVYQEGIHLVETQPKNKIAERAIRYYREDRKIQQLIKEIEEFSGFTCK